MRLITYKWTEKRKAAIKRLGTLGIFLFISMFFNRYLNVFEPSLATPKWNIIAGILIIIGIYQIASDIYIVLFDKEDEA